MTALLGPIWSTLGERFGYRWQILRAHFGTLGGNYPQSVLGLEWPFRAAALLTLIAAGLVVLTTRRLARTV